MFVWYRAAVVFLLFLGLSGPLRSEPVPSAASPLAGRIIVLDPGHAVKDESDRIFNPGARARHGVYERDVVLSVAEMLKPLLEAQGAKVFMTRTRANPWRYGADRRSDNQARAIFANLLRADVYVRLHCDWNRDRHFKGFTTYYYRWGSRRLGKEIRQALVQRLVHHKDNGLHRRSFVGATARMPAVLIEMGVLSNRSEAKALALESYQTRIATAISEGLVNYFRGQGLTPPPATATASGVAASTIPVASTPTPPK